MEDLKQKVSELTTVLDREFGGATEGFSCQFCDKIIPRHTYLIHDSFYYKRPLIYRKNFTSPNMSDKPADREDGNK